MKIDFSNPPASSRKNINPVQTALDGINASIAKSTVSKANIAEVLAGPTFKSAEKTVELYAPVRIKKSVASSEPSSNAGAVSASASLKNANFYKLFMA